VSQNRVPSPFLDNVQIEEETDRPSFLECLNDSPWLWWPIELPSRTTPLSLFQLLKASVFYAALPFFISFFAMLGAVYLPSSFLMAGVFPQLQMGTLMLAAGWWLVFLLLLSVPFTVWNKRAKRLNAFLRTQAQKSSFGAPLASQGQASVASTVLQSAWQSTRPTLTHVYPQWQQFGASISEAVAAPFSWAGLTMVLLGFPVIIMSFSLVFLPSLLKGVGEDMAKMQPALALKPMLVDVAPLSFEATQLNDFALDRRLCCLHSRSEEKENQHEYQKSLPALQRQTDQGAQIKAEYRPLNFKRPLSMMLPTSGWMNGQMGQYQTVCSPEGKCLFYEQDPNLTQRRLVIPQASKRDRRGLFLEYRAIKTDFDLSQKGLGEILTTTPTSLPWFALPQETLKHFNRLMNKFFLLSTRQNVYFLQSDRWQAYQLGHPEKDNWVQVVLFDHHEGWLTLNFGTRSGAKEAFTQKEIQDILASLEPMVEMEVPESHLDKAVDLGSKPLGEAAQSEKTSLFDQTGVDQEID
jgi:hypothetical protein